VGTTIGYQVTEQPPLVPGLGGSLPVAVAWTPDAVSGTLGDKMADEQGDVLAASTEPEQAVDTPTVIDPDDLEKARLDERWRELCLNAERYVAETTRPSARVGQPA
jgi:hypothetical protein